MVILERENRNSPPTNRLLPERQVLRTPRWNVVTADRIKSQ